MADIVVINKIKLSHFGPVNELGQPVHLQQGSLDGACGPYSLLMCMTICGQSRQHSKLVNLEPIRRNTATGRALLKMQELTTSDQTVSLLFRNGTELQDLQEIAKSHGFVATEAKEARRIHKNSNEFKNKRKDLDTAEVRDFVVNNIIKNDPVIVWLQCEDFAHWAVVIGVEFADIKDREKRKATRLFLLDPDVPTPQYCAWNGVIELSPRKDWHSWGCLNGVIPVRFHKALAVSRAERRVS